jgi:integrase
MSSTSSTSSRNSSLRVPSYRRHKPTDQAVVTIDGRDIYLGKWNSAASRAEYNRLIGEWLAAGRRLPVSGNDITVAELSRAYLAHAKSYYVKNGKPTGWLVHIKLVIRHLRTAYGHTRAVKFGPLAFKALRQGLIEKGHSRGYINKLMAIVQRIFKWGASEQLVPGSVYQDLRTVEGLRRGRCEAPDHPPVKPVPDEAVDAVLPFLPPVVADMVRFQRLTGCRPGEACIVRPCDIDTSGEVWIYRPESHKTEHFGRERTICIGPQAQNILRPYLLRDKSHYCFVPAESERKRNARRRENRKSPMTPSQARRRPVAKRKKAPGDRYDKDSYRRAITRALKRLNDELKKQGSEPMPHWTPNQLRHNAATKIRKQFGLEAAQVCLGHSSADVSQIYAERDCALASEVARKIG